MRKAERLAIFQRDDNRCSYCGIRYQEIRYYDDAPSWCGGPRWVANLHIDHVVPKRRGGTDDPSNLVAACADCNLAKYNRTPLEWLAGESRG